jgi:hypothetical protein
MFYFNTALFQQLLITCRTGNPGLPATSESVPISGQRNDERAINAKVSQT